MCPVCNTTLAQSNSDAAKAIERVIQGRIRAGWTKSQISQAMKPRKWNDPSMATAAERPIVAIVPGSL